MIGLVSLLILTRRYILAAVGGFASLVVGTGLLLFTNFGSTAQNFFNRGENADQTAGLSGRLETWTNSYDNILKHPFIGYGGFAGARFVVLNKNSPGSSSLNSFIDGALDIGIMGPVILLVVLILVGWTLFKSTTGSRSGRPESCLALEMFVAFVILVVRSVESSNLITHPMLSFLTIVGAAQVLRYERKTVLAMNPQHSFSCQS
jgi:O-antigen ligase